MKPATDAQAEAVVVAEKREPQGFDLIGDEVQKELGIARQTRARLRARIAGNVVGAVVAADYRSPRASGKTMLQQLGHDASELAEAILVECGL